jgi:site-specific DNA-methyltransferase (adenine-specific)
VGHVAQTILGRPHAVIYWSEGLNAPWSAMDGTPSRVFLNPPYGREMPRWIEKAVAEVEAGHCERVVALIPARTDTKCWQRYILKEAAYDRIAAPESLLLVRFLPGRVKFVGASASAPFPSAVVVWER